MKNILRIVVLSLLLSCNVFAGAVWPDRDIIKVIKCWNPLKYKDYKQDKAESINQGKTKWEWELNLKERIAYRITESSDQLSKDKLNIRITTKNSIVVNDITGEVVFFLNMGGLVTVTYELDKKEICSYIY
tara:strand:+ start:260 stop:652 length:393 start_codon:yes stop_codon:yes gene_type:complete